MLYLYAITEGPQAGWPELRGLQEAPVAPLPWRELAAVVSPVASEMVPPTEANLWRHERVVESVMAYRAVLPVRFGTVVEDEPALRSLLQGQYDRFTVDLDRVRGRVELGVRVLTAAGAEPPPDRGCSPTSAGPAASADYGSGRAYLWARLEEERRVRAARAQAESLVAGVHGALAPLAAHSTHRVLATPRLLLTAAYLLEREQVPAFRQQVEALSQAHPQLHFLCTGPWPPYSFVTTAAPGLS